jgi:hypothetical protein
MRRRSEMLPTAADSFYIVYRFAIDNEAVSRSRQLPSEAIPCLVLSGDLDALFLQKLFNSIESSEARDRH